MKKVCFYCGALLTKKYEEDHFPIPQSCGGTEKVSSCLSCHDMKDRFILEDWPEKWKECVKDEIGLLGRESKLWLAKITRVMFDWYKNYGKEST